LQEFQRYKQSEIGKLPDEWEVKKLGDILELCQYGLSIKLTGNGRYPVFRMNNIKNGKVVTNDLKYVDLDWKVFEQFKLEKGDILFNRTNSYDLVGKVGIFLLDGDYTFASYLIRIRANNHLSNPLFLNYYLNSRWAQEKLKNLATRGVSQSNINGANLRSIHVAFPSLKEQAQIASILSLVDELIHKTEKIIEQTQRVKKGLLERLFTRGIGHNEYRTIEYGTQWMTFRIPIGWQFSSLDKVARFRQGLQVAKVQRYKQAGKNRIKLIKVTDFHSDKQSDEYIDIPVMKSVICKKEDIIIARTGTLGLVLTDKEGVFHNNTFAIDYDKSLFDKMFFYYYLTTPMVQLYIKIISTRTSQSDLTHKEFSRLIVPIPSIQEQRKIAQVIMNIQGLIKLHSNYLSLYNDLKKELMEKLLTGKIRVKV
jgi:type I restriction enzyme S subunit